MNCSRVRFTKFADAAGFARRVSLRLAGSASRRKMT